ncbi:hypothetical protein AAFH68_23300 [Flavobacterium sp. CGRL1]
MQKSKVKTALFYISFDNNVRPQSYKVNLQLRIVFFAKDSINQGYFFVTDFNNLMDYFFKNHFNLYNLWLN